MAEGLELPTRNLLSGTALQTGHQAQHPLEEQLQGLSVGWRSLSVYRRRRVQRSMWTAASYEHVKVLDEVSGIATQGNLIAIMGASGAGKTSLLAAISERDRASLTGSVLLGGRPSGGALARMSGFVPQHDLTIDDLTVQEHMKFMARMMMDRHASTSTRARRVQQLLTELSVSRCGGTRLSALSGGERKRISLAVQLLNDPPILFCDEPTTGLDSWAASAVVSRLRGLAAAGKLVICTIHQPASGVFEMFDQVIFLAGGRVAFQGSIDVAVRFFSGLGYKCPVGFNQAEYLVSQLCVEVGQERESQSRIRRICDEFRRSDLAAAIEDQLEAQCSEDPNITSTIFDPDGTSQVDLFKRLLKLKKVGRSVQFCWCMWRDTVALRHNYSISVFDIAAYMLIGLVIAISYSGVARSPDQRDVQNVEGLMYLTVTQTIFIFIYSVFAAWPRELPAFLRESADGLYSPAPYFLSKTIFWIPRAVVFPVLYLTLLYFVVGLQGGVRSWFWLAFICVLCANAANAYGSFLSATFESIETAALVSVPADQFGVMFSGIVLNLESLPPAVAWLKYLSPFYYGTEAVSIIQWQAVTEIRCVDIPGTPCVRTGEEVLAQYGYQKSNFWIDAIGLSSLYVFFNIVAYIMVWRRSKRAAVY